MPGGATGVAEPLAPRTGERGSKASRGTLTSRACVDGRFAVRWHRERAVDGRLALCRHRERASTGVLRASVRGRASCGVSAPRACIDGRPAVRWHRERSRPGEISPHTVLASAAAEREPETSRSSGHACGRDIARTASTRLGPKALCRAKAWRAARASRSRSTDLTPSAGTRSGLVSGDAGIATHEPPGRCALILATNASSPARSSRSSGAKTISSASASTSSSPATRLLPAGVA
ncbi:hypothetical protein A4R44_03251 [Amycolatopsis sp. M39]|nr:hypothetical protein A4R44_03251 [Amycolatopsis sp. M39]